MHASNFSIYCLGNDLDHLKSLLEIALDDGKACCWKEEGHWLVVYWFKQDNANFFLGIPGPATLLNMCNDWLNEKDPSSPKPDIDGTVKAEGFEFRCGWTSIDQVRSSDYGADYELFRIKREWAEYHK